jgi:hypothetical protein
LYDTNIWISFYLFIFLRKYILKTFFKVYQFWSRPHQLVSQPIVFPQFFTSFIAFIQNLLESNTETSRKVIVTGITSAVIVFVQMRLKNSAGESNWSDPMSARIPLPTEPKVKFLNS